MNALASCIKWPSTLALLTAIGSLGCAGGASGADNDAASGPSVVVVRATNACFSDMVRVTGFVVPRREAVANVDSEGSRVTELLVREGDTVTANQDLARLTPAPTATSRTPVTLRAPAAGLVTKVNTIVGAPASPQAAPMFQIAIDNELELDAEVPSIHVMKLSAGATARISRDDAPDLTGRVRLIAPEIDRRTQLGHVRVSINNGAALKVGMFARVAIDAKRSCGVAIPRSAIDHSTVQVVTGNIVETRRVRVGLVSDASIEILDGLKQDEIVVADAGTSLHNGDRVKITFADDLDRSRVR